MDNYTANLRPDRVIFPLSELSENSANEFGDRTVMRAWDGEKYAEITYVEFDRRIKATGRWLKDQGIKQGDRIAVLGENRSDWGIAYLGIQASGAVVVPVDSMMPGPGIRHIISDSGAKILLVSSRFMTVVNEMEPIKTLETIVCFDQDGDDEVITLAEVIEKGEKSKTELPKRKLDELAAILYTSGTTGYSKGVMLTQENIVSNVVAASRIYHVGPDDTFLSVLPIHHSFECTAGFLLPIYCGSSITYARSLKSTDLVGDIRNTGVTMMVGVPLLYEKMHTGILRGIRKKGVKARVLFNTVYGVVSAGEKFGGNLGVKLFQGLREKAGFGTVKFFLSGGGPLNPATAYFFNRLGIRMTQGYGLTETSPVTHVNPPWKIRHETVGPCIPGVECRIDDANEQGIGEVVVRGPNVFKGYYKNEKATKEVLDAEGWFSTGDLGKIYDDGYLEIMGRKKNMLVTSGGKNVYPEEVEHYLNRSPFIAESLVLGVARESGYGEDVAALIFPDYEQVDIHFEEKNINATPEDVYELIKSGINDLQKDLAEYKRVRRFKLKEVEFEKTSTRKIKRFLYDGDMLSVDEKK